MAIIAIIMILSFAKLLMVSSQPRVVVDFSDANNELVPGRKETLCLPFRALVLRQVAATYVYVLYRNIYIYTYV